MRLRFILLALLLSIISSGCLRGRSPKKMTTYNSDDKETADGKAKKEPEIEPEEDDQTPPELKYGFTQQQYDEGESFIGSWDGSADEISAGGRWTVKTISTNAAGSNPGTNPLNGGGTGNDAIVSYTGEIQPIINSACVSCHSATGSQSNSPLSNFQQVSGVRQAVVDRVANGSMPPNGGLTEQQKQLFTQWSKAGFPESPTSSGQGSGTVAGGATGQAGGYQETEQAVVFRIRAGTGSGPWNTSADPVPVRIGKQFIIINDDTVPHQMHTDGAPCPHGDPIQPGAQFQCSPNAAFDGELYDHLNQQTGKFYIRTVQ